MSKDVHPEEELQLGFDWESMEEEVGDLDPIEALTFSRACPLTPDDEGCEACQ